MSHMVEMIKCRSLNKKLPMLRRRLLWSLIGRNVFGSRRWI